MFRRTILVLAVLCAALPAIARAQLASPATQPAPPPATQPATQPSGAVAELIADLDSPEFSVRSDAEKKLIALGPSIENQLRAALAAKSISPEAQARISEILSRMDEFRAMHASITLHYRQAPVMDILRDFAAQAGSDLGVDDSAVSAFVRGRLGDIDLDNAPFWTAILEIRRVSGLSPWIGPNGLTLAPIQGRGMMQIDLASPLARASGGLLIVPQACQEMKSINYGTGQITGFFTFNAVVVAEPRMHIVGFYNFGSDWITQCVDDRGNSLLGADQNRRFFNASRMIGMPMSQQPMWPLNASLKEVPNRGSKIVKLHGNLDVAVETRSQFFEIKNITRARGIAQGDGHLVVTVISCSKTGNSYRLDLNITGTGGRLFIPEVQNFMSSARLMDDAGDVIPCQNMMPMFRANNATVTMMYVPTANIASKLRWDRTIEQKRITVPVDLQDLPLP
jgi:hypothetical protein